MVVRFKSYFCIHMQEWKYLMYSLLMPYNVIYIYTCKENSSEISNTILYDHEDQNILPILKYVFIYQS